MKTMFGALDIEKQNDVRYRYFSARSGVECTSIYMYTFLSIWGTLIYLSQRNRGKVPYLHSDIKNRLTNDLYGENLLIEIKILMLSKFST